MIKPNIQFSCTKLRFNKRFHDHWLPLSDEDEEGIWRHYETGEVRSLSKTKRQKDKIAKRQKGKKTKKDKKTKGQKDKKTKGQMHQCIAMDQKPKREFNIALFLYKI